MSSYITDLKGLVTTGLEMSTPTAKHSTSAKAGKDLQMEDFLQLMVATFQNQTIDNQADISDMMNQMVQMSVVQAISNISSLITDTTNLSYAASLVGKEVIVAQQSGRTTNQISGTVTGTGMLDGSPVVFMGDKSYWLSDVMAVGSLPSEEAQAENAQAVKNAEASWHSEQNAAATMDAAARAALQSKDETVDALLEALKPSDEDKRAEAITDILTGTGGSTTESLLTLLGSTDGDSAKTGAVAQLLDAMNNPDNNGNVTIPAEVLEDAVQQIGIL
ncbi:MAG: hypothetical protein IKN96_01945 [Oscillibacter sp.]|nr:hypothetical protein [Oscillibacter sp.]